jgi:TATA-binding protein-associated factor Taf7
MRFAAKLPGGRFRQSENDHEEDAEAENDGERGENERCSSILRQKGSTLDHGC